MLEEADAERAHRICRDAGDPGALRALERLVADRREHAALERELAGRLHELRRLLAADGARLAGLVQQVLAGPTDEDRCRRVLELQRRLGPTLAQIEGLLRDAHELAARGRRAS